MLSRYVTHYYESLRQRIGDAGLIEKKRSTTVKLQQAASLMSCVALRLSQFHVQSALHRPTSKLDCSGLSNCILLLIIHTAEPTFTYVLSALLLAKNI